MTGYDTGATLYAFPANKSLADWATYRIRLIEGTGPDAGQYSATVDTANGGSWLAFSGETQPTSWSLSLARALWNLTPTPTLVLTGYPAGAAVFAFPLGRSLADWATYAVEMTEGTGADAGRYLATVSSDAGEQWVAFEGADQPDAWPDAIPGVQWDTTTTPTVQVTPGRSQSVHLEIDQAGGVQIPAYREDGTAIDWTGKTLRFTTTDNRKTLLLDITNAYITRTAGSFTVTVGGDLTAKRRTLRWRLLEVSGGNEIEILQGLFPVY